MVRVRYEETRGPHEEFKTHRGVNFLAAKSQQRLSEVGNADGPNWKTNLKTGLTYRVDGQGVSTVQIRLKARSITFCD